METRTRPVSSKRGSLLGSLSFASALVAAVSVAMIGFTSFTTFNPPDWLRILTMAPLPFAIILAIGFGLSGLKKTPSRVWAMAGLVLAGLSIVAFIVMISVGG